ncbi:hypothetical protein BDV93DRAFT_546161 [Ceratobasidium sp. AG-I]|nr:hypothetical protein BDV93DRAFT_546161 [Ceratobasidium sp. AG-I]
MSARSTFILPPIPTGDVFTCQGNGLLYEGIARVPIDELRHLLSGGSGQLLIRNRKEPKKWFEAQCAHYGLPTKHITSTLRNHLDTFLALPDPQVPPELERLEEEKNEEYRTLSETINQVRSPAPRRSRGVMLLNDLGAGLFQALGHESPREPQSEPAVHRGDNSAISTEQVQPVQNGKGKGKNKELLPVASGSLVQPIPSSQADSTVSGYSSLDASLGEYLDEVEQGIEMLETDPDGDSQMNPPSSPPPIQASSPSPPQTPKRTQHASATTPSALSPKYALERDVVSGTWALHIVVNTTRAPVSPRRSSRLGVDMGGSMNLHLAEDHRSLVGEFSLQGMEGVVKSRSLEGRMDGAYALLSYVGQVSIEQGKGKGVEGSSRIYGPSLFQNGYLRFSDGRKDADGRYTLKGSLRGAGFDKIDFEGVREGDERDLCAKWDDFVD